MRFGWMEAIILTRCLGTDCAAWCCVNSQKSGVDEDNSGSVIKLRQASSEKDTMHEDGVEYCVRFDILM
jgi:hypothetical protein